MSKRGRLGLTSLALICVAAVVAGCGSSSSSSSSSSSGSTASSGGKKLTVGYVAFSLSTVPQQEMKKGQEQEGQKFGYTVTTVDGGGEPAKANAAMQTLITQGVNAIVIDSYGGDSIKAGLLAAKSAKIPVYVPYAPGPNNEVAWAVRGNAGTISAQVLVKNLGSSGSVLALTLPAGPNCVSSQQQFEAIMKNNPGIKVREQPIKVPGYQQEAATTTQGWLKSHPSSEKLAIWGCWDGPATAAASALNEAGRHDVKVYGQNTEASTIALLEKKQYTASWYFDSVAFGAHMIDLIHEQASTPYEQIKPQFGKFPSIEVNQSNVKEFVSKYPQVVG